MQLTVPDGPDWSAVVNVRGKTGDYTTGGGDDWEATLLRFSADLVAPKDNGHRRQLGSNEGWSTHVYSVPERAGNTEFNNW